MLLKEFDYGLRKYNLVFLTTLVLILLFYRGMNVAPKETSVLILHSTDLTLAEIPGVSYQRINEVTPAEVFRQSPKADAYLYGKTPKLTLLLNPQSLNSTQVLMALDSLRYQHTYRLVPVVEEGLADQSGLVQTIAQGFIFSFLCLYLPVMSWKLEDNMRQSLYLTPVKNGHILSAKQVVVVFLVVAAWAFYWFLFSPSLRDLVLLIVISLAIVQVGQMLGILRGERIGEVGLYIGFILLMFASPALQFIQGWLGFWPILCFSFLLASLLFLGANRLLEHSVQKARQA